MPDPAAPPVEERLTGPEPSGVARCQQGANVDRLPRPQHGEVLARVIQPELSGGLEPAEQQLQQGSSDPTAARDIAPWTRSACP